MPPPITAKASLRCVQFFHISTNAYWLPCRHGAVHVSQRCGDRVLDRLGVRPVPVLLLRAELCQGLGQPPQKQTPNCQHSCPRNIQSLLAKCKKKKKKPQFKSLCSVAWGTVEVGNLFAMAATCSTFHVRHFLHEAIQRQRVRVGVHIQIAEPRLFRVAILPSRGNTRCAHCTGPGPSCTGTCLGFPANICYNRCATALLTKVVQCPL